MRVLFFISNLTMGGAEHAILRAASALQKAGHEAAVLLLEDRIDIPPPPGIQIDALSPHPLRNGWLNKHRYAWQLRRRFAQVNSGDKVDLVISTLPFADEIASLAKIPRLWLRVTNTLSAEVASLGASPAKARRRERRYRALYEKACTIAISDGVRDDLIQNFGAAPERVVRVYNPFDFAEIGQLATESDEHVPSGLFVLHAARFAPAKRHDLLLEAFLASSIPHHLVLLTDPHPGLEKMIRERHLVDKVTIAGFRKNPFPWIKKASAMILSSDREGMSNILVEALVCGTPVVSTDCPSGPREILNGDLARWLSPVGDADALARNLRAVVQSPPELGAWDIARFSAPTFVAAVESLVDRTEP